MKNIITLRKAQVIETENGYMCIKSCNGSCVTVTEIVPKYQEYADGCFRFEKIVAYEYEYTLSEIAEIIKGKNYDVVYED